jgi:hypothetical protein
VDGKTIPLVDFDVGPSWSGLIPISNATNEDRKVRGLSDWAVRWLRPLTRDAASCSSGSSLLGPKGVLTI